MRIKLDENLPTSLAEALAKLGHDVDTVPREGLAGRGDPSIWSAAQKAGRFLITQDLDFSDIRRFRPGTHESILLVRLRMPGRRALFQRVEALFRTEDVERWKGWFVVASDHKIRVLRPILPPNPPPAV
jgi:predicted nuclease of predicted toxin-antitoxin system